MKLNRLIYLVLFIILLPLALGLSFSWWDTNWNYRKLINITEQSGTNLTDYQVRLTIDTASLISEGKLNSDCSDIRFTWLNESSGEEVEVPYWIESGCNTSNTIVWIKVPEILANSTATIYMYYGNPSATSASNGSAVFDFFDDFETWSGWVNYSNGEVFQNCSFSYEGSCSLQKDTNGDPNGGYKELGFTLNYPFIFEAWIDRTYLSGSDQDRIGVIDADGNGYGIAIDHSNDALLIDIRTGYSASQTASVSLSSDPVNVWYFVRFIWNNGNIICEVYDNSGNLLANTSATHTSYSSFTRVYVFGGYTYYVDLMKIRKYVDPEPNYTFSAKEEIYSYSETVDPYFSFYDYAFMNDTSLLQVEFKHPETKESIINDTICQVEYLGTFYNMTYNSTLDKYVFNLTPSYDYYHQNYTIYCNTTYYEYIQNYENETHIIYHYYRYFNNKTETDYFDVYIGEIPEDWPLTDRPYRIVVRVKNPSDTYPILDYIYNVTIDTTSYVSNGMMRSDCLDIEAYYKQRIGYIKFKICNDKYSKPHDKWWFTYQFDPDTLAQYAIHQPSFIDIRAFTYFPENPYLETPDVDAWYIGNNKFVFIVSKTLNPGQCTDVYVFFGGYNKDGAYKYQKPTETFSFEKVTSSDEEYHYTLGVCRGSLYDAGWDVPCTWSDSPNWAWPGFYYLGYDRSEAKANLANLSSISDEKEEFTLMFISPFPLNTDPAKYATIVATSLDQIHREFGKGCSDGTSINIYRDGQLYVFTVKITDINSVESCIDNLYSIFGSNEPNYIWFALFPQVFDDNNMYFAFYKYYQYVYEANATVEEISTSESLMKLPTAVKDCNTGNTLISFLIPVLYPEDEKVIYLFFGDGNAHAYSGGPDTVANKWISSDMIKLESLSHKYYYTAGSDYGYNTWYTTDNAFAHVSRHDSDDNMWYENANRYSYYADPDCWRRTRPFRRTSWPWYEVFSRVASGYHEDMFARQTFTFSFMSSFSSTFVNSFSYSFDFSYEIHGYHPDYSIRADIWVGSFHDYTIGTTKSGSSQASFTSETFGVTVRIGQDGTVDGDNTKDAQHSYAKFYLENFTLDNPYDPEYVEHWEDSLFKVTSPKMYDAKHNITLIKATVPGGTDWVEFWMTKPDGSDELIANDTNRSDGFEVEFDFSNYPEGYYELWINTSSGLSPVRVKIYVDHTNPTAITEKPEPVVYYDRNIVVKVYGNDNYALDKCYYKLDTGSWQEVPCGLPIKIYNLAEGEHTFWSRVIDKAGLMSEDTVKFMIYKYYGGLAMRPTPTPARGLVLPPAELIELRRRYETLRRAVLITGTASIASIIYLILLILGIL